MRLNCIELEMAPTCSAIHIQGVDFFEALRSGEPLTEIAFIEQNAVTRLDEPHW